jgi:hypothetical protein
MDSLSEDCRNYMFGKFPSRSLATLTKVSRKYTQWALAEETRRHGPLSITDADHWDVIVISGAYLTAVRTKYAPILLDLAVLGGNNMVDLALALGATDYEDGYVTAARESRENTALRMWRLIEKPDLGRCVFNTFAGGNATLMALFDCTGPLMNFAVCGACAGEQLELLKGIFHKYTDSPCSLLLCTAGHKSTETYDFLVANGIKCESVRHVLEEIVAGCYDDAIILLRSNPELDVGIVLYQACAGGHEPMLRYIRDHYKIPRATISAACEAACTYRRKNIIAILSTMDGFVGYDEIVRMVCAYSRACSGHCSIEEIITFCAENSGDAIEGVLRHAIDYCREMEATIRQCRVGQ